jgi:ABC-type glycerol-3-phosphate transport system substrate-binding protein
LNSPESVAALSWVVDNFRTEKIYPADIVTYDYTEFHTLFYQGKVAMAINWPYMWGQAQDPAQSTVVDKVGVGLKPKQAAYGGEIGGWSWNVFRMSKNQDAAIAFAKWMSSPKAGEAYAGAASWNPVRKSISVLVAEKDPVLAGAIAANQESGRSVRWLDTGPSWTEIEKVVYESIQRGLIGDGDPQGILDDANEQVKEILEKNKFYEELLPQLKTGA